MRPGWGFVFFLFSAGLRADSRLQAFEGLIEAKQERAAAAFMDFEALLAREEASLDAVRFLLLGAVANLRSGDYSRARERLREARRMVAWASPRSPLAADAKIRRRAESALELVEHDLMASLAADPGEASPE